MIEFGATFRIYFLFEKKYAPIWESDLFYEWRCHLSASQYPLNIDCYWHLLYVFRRKTVGIFCSTICIVRSTEQFAFRFLSTSVFVRFCCYPTDIVFDNFFPLCLMVESFFAVIDKHDGLLLLLLFLFSSITFDWYLQ